jgi:hypothetical protein
MKEGVFTGRLRIFLYVFSSFSSPSNLTFINDNYNPKTGFVNSKLVVLGKIDSVYRPVFSDFPVKAMFFQFVKSPNSVLFFASEYQSCDAE